MRAAVEREIEANGMRFHVAEQGEGPLIVLCHGWPELKYSWRHQLPALAAAGYRVVAPDMRGYGRSSAPADIHAYSLLHLVGDVVAIVHACGEKEAIVIGHDWGAPVAWTAAQLRPDMFRRVVGMSVPHRGRGPSAPLTMLRNGGYADYYWIYFQTPGVAEAEFEADVDDTFRRLLYSLSGASSDAEVAAMGRVQSRFLANTQRPDRLPSWLDEADINHFVAEFTRTGFRGGLNWYRNLDRNWELLAPWAGAIIQQPALFIAGTRDPMVHGERGRAALTQMHKAVPNVSAHLIEGAGHWIQQERPEEVNRLLVNFLTSS